MKGNKSAEPFSGVLFCFFSVLLRLFFTSVQFHLHYTLDKKSDNAFNWRLFSASFFIAKLY